MTLGAGSPCLTSDAVACGSIAKIYPLSCDLVTQIGPPGSTLWFLAGLQK
jgi:hypothetical protein